MGPYRPESYWYEFRGIVTNCTPTDAYRGAGRPEATYVLERLVDAFARKIGKDPADVRRMNFHPPFDEATTSICGLNVDSGNYEPLLDKALELSAYDEVRKEQQARRDRGDTKQLGIGLSTYIEMCGLAPSNILGALRYAAGGWDGATIECTPGGGVIVKTGTSPHGQGHETSWSQIVADGLGVDPDKVEVLHGDTAITPLGMDTYGSRSLSVGGVALHFAMEKIKEKARTIAAHELEVSEDDLEWADGSYRVKGAPDKARTIPDLAVSAWHAHDLPAGVEPHLNATAVYDPPNFTWPSGAHIAVVEVDTETGATDIVKYIAVDDCGTVINPMIVEGQVHGGVAQGVAEALYEEAIYDEGGQPLHVVDDPVPGAHGGGDPHDHHRQQPGDAVHDEPAGCEGDRRGRHDRLAARGDQRRGGRPLPPRGDRRGQAGLARAGLASYPGRARRCRMIPAPFEYARAESVDHAIELLGSSDDAKILAGGHSLLPLMKVRFAQPSLLVDIGRIGDLSYVREDDDVIAIGALTRHQDVANSELLQTSCPIVADAAGQIGDPQVRHMGTIGGAVAHSDPASDMPTVMLALGAQMVVRSAGGQSRTVAAADFFQGLFTADLQPNEVLVEVRVPKTSGGWSYLKFNRRAIDWALVGVAAVQQNGSAAVTLTNMGETPIRATGVEEALAGGADPATAAQRADEGTAPPSDAFGSAEYRRELSKVLVRRALEEALG